jgi:hypothetical protein
VSRERGVDQRRTLHMPEREQRVGYTQAQVELLWLRLESDGEEG